MNISLQILFLDMMLEDVVKYRELDKMENDPKKTCVMMNGQYIMFKPEGQSQTWKSQVKVQVYVVCGGSAGINLNASYYSMELLSFLMKHENSNGSSSRIFC